MAQFFQQVFLLLNTPLGSLAYNLVLSFSIVAALLTTLYYGRSGESPLYRRILIGLSLLLVFRLGLFIAAGLAWQKLVSSEFLLPPLSRGVDLLSLLVIFWLWVVPAPSRKADLAVGILSLGVMVLIGLVLTGLLNGVPDKPFNGSQMDRVVQAGAITIAALGCLLLAMNRPDGWVAGLFMLGLIGAGHLMQFVFPPADGDYSGVVRLTQMIAYPLLIVIPQRLLVSTTASLSNLTPITKSSIPDRSESFTASSYQEVQAVFLNLISEDEPDKVGQALVEVLARALQADFCLIGMINNGGGQFETRYTYDLVHKQYIPPLTIASQTIPIITSAYHGDQILRLRGNSTVPDLPYLARALDLKRIGPLLAHPFRGIDNQPFIDLLLLSPFSDRNWISADEKYLEELAMPLVLLLDHKLRVAGLELELETTRQALLQSEVLKQQVEGERDHLKEFITLTQAKFGPLSPPDSRTEVQDDERPRPRLH